MMMDNASNNDTMIEAIESRCHEAGVKFSARKSRMRCMPHTIHLAALKVCSIMNFFGLKLVLTISNINSCLRVSVSYPKTTALGLKALTPTIKMR